jgi:hypothetical protein
LTNVPILNETSAQEIYNDWRLRGRIEHGFRFDQGQGLDVEDLRVQTVERMGRVFALVPVAALSVFYIMKRWPPKAVLWLHKLDRRLGLKTHRDSPDILLRGFSTVWQTVAMLSLTVIQPSHTTYS